MEQLLEQIRDQQKESWNKFSPGWKKWDKLFMDFLKPMGDEIIQILNPKNKNIVLDVAAGTGEPGLTIATKLSGGKVILADLAEDMLGIASENAMQRGIKNIRTRACDVSDLPFADNTFDGVSCRFGFMFFPDMQLAAKEMVRVLKPGGKIATSVWNGPEKNFWVTAIMETITRNMQLPVPSADAPGMFRCSGQSFMKELLREAGLKNIVQKEIHTTLNCKTPDVYWNLMTEIGAPVVTALEKADAATKQKIKKEVYQAVSQRYGDGNIMIDASALVLSGEK